MTKAERLQATATLIGTVEGITFYEDPRYGGDVGMRAIYKGEALSTDWYDLPRPDDMDGPEDFMATCPSAEAWDYMNSPETNTIIYTTAMVGLFDRLAEESKRLTYPPPIW